MKTLSFLIGLILLGGCVGISLQAGQVTVEWDPSPSTDITNYTLYISKTPGNYTPPLIKVMVGTNLNTRVIHTNLVGRCYFVATAHNSSGFESDYSNEVFADFPSKLQNLKVKP